MKKIFLLMFVIFLISNAYAQDKCNDVLMPDTSSVNLDLAKIKNILNIFKSNHIETYDDYKNFMGKATVPIEGVTWDFGSDITADNFQQFKDDLYKYESLDETTKIKFEKQERHLSEYVVNAWEHCIGSNDLNIWVIQGADPHTFILAGKYGGALQGAKITNIQFSEKVTTGGGNFTYKSGVLKLHSIWNSAPQYQMFTRTNNNPLTISISATTGNGFNGTLAKIVLTPKPPVKKNMFYKIVITKDDNAMHINSIEGGVKTLRYNSGFADLTKPVYKEVNLNWLKNGTNIIEYEEINSHMDCGVSNINPYDFLVTIYRVEKINGKIVEQVFDTYHDSGNDACGDPVIRFSNPIKIEVPDDVVLVNSTLQL